MEVSRNLLPSWKDTGANVSVSESRSVFRFLLRWSASLPRAVTKASWSSRFVFFRSEYDRLGSTHRITATTTAEAKKVGYDVALECRFYVAGPELPVSGTLLDAGFAITGWIDRWSSRVTVPERGGNTSSTALAHPNFRITASMLERLRTPGSSENHDETRHTFEYLHKHIVSLSQCWRERYATSTIDQAASRSVVVERIRMGVSFQSVSNNN